MSLRKTLIFSISLFVILCAIGIYVLVSNASATVTVLSTAKWPLLLIALAFTALSYFFAGLGFSATARIFSANAPFLDTLQIGFITTAVNNVASIGGLAGHSMRATLFEHFGIGEPKGIAVSIFYSYFNNIVFFVLFPIALIYLAFEGRFLQLSAFTAVIAICLFLLFVRLSTAFVYSSKIRMVFLNFLKRAVSWLFHRNISASFAKFDSAMTYGVDASKKKKAGMAVLLATLLLDWLSSIAALGFCFYAVGSLLSPGDLVTGFVVGTTLGAISVIPGGLGVQDVSMVAVFHVLGAQLQQAILAMLAFRFVYYAVPYVLSLFSYWNLIRQKEIAEN